MHRYSEDYYAVRKEGARSSAEVIVPLVLEMVSQGQERNRRRLWHGGVAIEVQGTRHRRYLGSRWRVHKPKDTSDS